RQNDTADEIAPNTACPLFVPSAMCGGRPAAMSDGTVTSPPPPAMASTNPAKKAASARIAIAEGASTRGSLREQDERTTQKVAHSDRAAASVVKSHVMFKRGAMRLGLALAGVLALVVYLRTRPAEPHGSAFAIVTSAGAITPQPAASFAVVE